MRGVLEDVALARLASGFDLGDLGADGDQGVDEAVQLGLVLGLGGLDHQSVGDGPGHGGCVEAVVLETLGNVDGFDAASVLEAADVQDELVGTAAVLVGVQDRVVGLETGHDIVGVQEGDLGCVGEASVAHHVDVVECDGENAGAAPGSGTDRGRGVVAALGLEVLAGWVGGQEGTQVLGHTDGSDTGTTTTVWDTEGLVQVQVANVGADLTGRAETDLGVHVGSVHVDLTAGLVDQTASLLGTGLEDTKGTGVGDHECGELVLVLLALGLEIGKIQVTGLGVTLDGNNTHTSHGSTGGVGTVSRDGNQADVALVATLGFLELLDDTETSKLTLGTRVGLHSNLGHASDIGELLLQIIDHLDVALGLVSGHEGVHLGEFGPRNGNHLSGSVELHGARSQGNHGVGQGQILGLEVTDVAEHFGLRVVGVEDGVGHVLRGTLQTGRQGCDGKSAVDLNGGSGLVSSKDLQDVLDLLTSNSLIKGETNLVTTEATQEDGSVAGSSNNSISLGGIAELNGKGVENGLALGVGANGNVVSQTDQLLAKQSSHGHDALSNRLETNGAVVDSVHGSHVGKKSLSSADVASSLLTANVLLTSLQSKTQSTVAKTILGHTDNTTRHLTLVLVGTGEESGVGTTKAHGNTQSLGATEGDISTELTGGLENSQSKQIGGNAEGTALAVDRVTQGLEVINTTLGIGVLSQNTNQVVTLLLDQLEVLGKDISNNQVDSESLGTRLHDGNGLGVAQVGHHEGLVGLLLLGSGHGGEGHGHGLGGGGGLIQNGGIGEGETGQISGQGLEVQKGLQTTLADFGLVRSVASVPGGVLQHIAENHRGDNGRVVTSSNVSLARNINLLTVGVQQLQHVSLSQTTLDAGAVEVDIGMGLGDLEVLLGKNVLGQDLLDELIQIGSWGVQHGQHLRRGIRRGTNVATREGIEGLENVLRVGITMSGHGASVDSAASCWLGLLCVKSACEVQWCD